MYNSLFKNEQDILLFDKTLGIMVDDKIALEGIYNSMEKSIPHGGLDLASKDIVNVTLEHILNKYAIDDIPMLSNNVPSVMSLEALKDKITELGKAAKRLLITIWKATVAFGKEVIKFVKVHVFRQKEKAKLTEAVVKEFTNIAEQISNNKVPVDRTVVVNGVTYILVDKVTKLTKPNSAIYPADLPEVDDVPEPIDDTTFSKTNKKHENPSKLKAHVVPGAVLLPKETIVEIAKVIETEPPEEMMDTSFGMIFNKHGELPEDDMEMYKILSNTAYASAYVKGNIEEIIIKLQKTIENVSDEPGVSIMLGSIRTKSHNIDPAIKTLADGINELMMDGKLGTPSSASPGIFLKERPIHPDSDGHIKHDYFFSHTKFKNTFDKPKVAAAKLPVLSIKRLKRLQSNIVDDVDDIMRIDESYQKLLKFNLEKYQNIENNQRVDWCLGWLVTLYKVVANVERYDVFYMKYINEYIDECYKHNLNVK